MKKEFKIEGMNCGHCRKSIEDALNTLPGVKAAVSLEPPAAIVEFKENVFPVEQLQAILSAIGDYRITE